MSVSRLYVVNENEFIDTMEGDGGHANDSLLIKSVYYNRLILWAVLSHLIMNVLKCLRERQQICPNPAFILQIVTCKLDNQLHLI